MPTADKNNPKEAGKTPAKPSCAAIAGAVMGLPVSKQSLSVQLAYQLRYFRVTSGLSQEKIAERAGISVKMLQRYEHGKSGRTEDCANPGLTTLGKLAEAFGVKVNELLEIKYDAIIEDESEGKQ